jgi:transcription-repair coupling factor (superfamily II helicase)
MPDAWGIFFQNQALAGYRRRLREGSVFSLATVPAPGQAFLIAGLRATEKKAMLIIAESVRAQEELANDLEAWGVPFLFYPETEPVVVEALPDPEMAAERMAVLGALPPGFSGVVLATETGLEQPIPNPAQMRASRLVVALGAEDARERWLASLEAAGYQREQEVQGRGQYSVRGSVVDVFSWDAALPLRTEWNGDTLESAREFDPVAQRSVRALPEAAVSTALPQESGALSGTLGDYLPGATRIYLQARPEEVGAELWDVEFFSHDFLNAPRGDFILQETRRDLFLEHLEDWLIEKWDIAIFCNNEGEQKRLTEIIAEAGIDPEALRFVQRPLLRGFVWPEGRLVVLSDAEIFGRYQTLRALRKQERLVATRARQNALDFTEWGEGDYVVHLHYGIAIYAGLQALPAGTNGGKEGAEVLVLEFAEQAKLYVPLEQAYLVSKYVGVGKKHPTLDTLGGSRWERAKVSARKAVMDYAAQLLKVQAEREIMKGHAFPPDAPWQKEFEDAFFYEETEDQLKAIVESKRDMETAQPMDRLICGDVGFGKTEVAIRAAFKAVMGGKQVAFLVPTTVLAQQHYETLRQRFADYPIQVDMLSRFRSLKEQKQTIARLKEGGVDVVVGTHRLISKDVIFKDLGLVIVDEEQRFGVAQKEKFKQLFRLVDVLTLSATPIPRTLYLALTGARDMSTIETPPAARLPVETVIHPYDERVIRDAIRRELARNGQVYFLHNRVQSIQGVAEKLKLLVPEARIDVGHGQMDEGDLEDVMARFVRGETDVLLSTTIIESGLDIPNANTILIDRADRFGLADLYQLRGRVGRAQHKAYAYLFLPRHLMAVGDARKRVNAIKQYSQLGAGFKIAMRDLEIRGAGNLLGTAQSGHITAVGFDLYCQLLKMAVGQLKGERPVRPFDSKLQLDFIAWQEAEADGDRAGAFLPRSYLPESRWRIEGYRKLAELRGAEDLELLKQEWRDRYGAWPPEVERLLIANEIRLLASERRIGVVETDGEKLVLRKGDDYVMIGGKFPRLTGPDANHKLLQIKQWILSAAPSGSSA